MKVKICDLDQDEKRHYVANSIGECRDSFDANIYNLVVKFQDVISMGKTVAYPV